MKYEVNFGSLSGTAPLASPSDCFRIAVLGDLSGRANLGKLESGDALAARKPLRVDVDNLDDILERLNIQLHLPISDGGGSVQVPLHEMDDFHPDELYDKLEVFSKLSGLRKKLADSSTFESAAKAVQSLLGSAAVERHSHRRQQSRGSAVPNAKLSDFASLMGRPTATEPATPVVELLKQIMRPHLSAEPDPRQDQMVATIDEALSDAMRRVLHHPDFQALESIWRCVELLVRRLETDSSLQIVLYDITAEEIAADLSSTDQLEETGLYKLFVEQPALDESQGPLSVLIGNYTFEQTPPHADLLGRIAKIAAAAKAPFIAGMSNECIKKVNPEDLHPLVKRSWEQLHALPEASYLALTVPRFMLRWPFGKKSEPIDSFSFEEFTRQSGVGGMLWGNSAFLTGLLLGLTCRQDGLKAMKLGSILGVNEMPYYYYTDEHGDQVALPCTDRLLSERLSTHVAAQNFIPVLSIKGRPEVRLGGFKSLSGQPLAGPWLASGEAAAAPTVAAPTTPAPTAVTSAPPSTTAPAPPAPTPSETPAPAAVEDNLDALLADLAAPPSSAVSADATPAAQATAPAEAPTADDELDALLADLGGGNESPPTSDDDMDPDLAALLGDL